jgi:hypothetical protein
MHTYDHWWIEEWATGAAVDPEIDRVDVIDRSTPCIDRLDRLCRLSELPSIDSTRSKFDRIDRLPVRKSLYKCYHTNTIFGESERLIALFIIINANESKTKLKCDEAEQLNSVT